ncbi:hypothetical protein ES703_80673 [subsurface metagenome]
MKKGGVPPKEAGGFSQPAFTNVSRGRAGLP